MARAHQPANGVPLNLIVIMHYNIATRMENEFAVTPATTSLHFVTKVWMISITQAH